MNPTPTLDTLRLPLICLLEELAGVLDALDDAQYTRTFPQAFDASIGRHVRHELDHVHALIEALHTGELNYDHRRRGTQVESDRAHAIRQIHLLTEQLQRLSDDRCAVRPITLLAMLSTDAPPVRTATTPARETAFVISHTVHHNAIISVMIHLLGSTHAPRFGYAPSTLAYLRDQAH